MKMYGCILLAFLAIILACSAARSNFDAETEKKITEICQKTDDTKFCRSIFANALIKTPSLSDKDLLNVTVRQSERISANTYFFITTLLRNAGEEKPDLQMCAEAYSNVDFAFEKAVVYFDEGDYSRFPNVTEKVLTSLDICKTNFTVPGFMINPLIQKNKYTTILVNVLKIVRNLVPL